MFVPYEMLTVLDNCEVDSQGVREIGTGGKMGHFKKRKVTPPESNKVCFGKKSARLMGGEGMKHWQLTRVHT